MAVSAPKFTQKIACLFAAAGLLLSAPAHAILHVSVDNPNPQPMPIALVDFISDDANSAQLGRDITRVAAADLERSGLFRPIDSSAFIEKPTSGNPTPSVYMADQILMFM